MDDAPWFDAPDAVRPAPHPPGRHRRLGHHRHHLPRPRRRAPLLQPVGQRLERRRDALRAVSRRSTTSRRCTVVDLLGNGTACLVWSSPLPGDARRPMRYVDLMGGQKPHLLVAARNNLGAETRVRYAPSTRFYLAGQARRHAVDHAAAVPGARGRAGRDARPDQRQPLRHALRAITTATSTASSASSAASAWSSSGTPRSSRRSAPTTTSRRRPTSTPRRTCRRCSRGPGSTPASTSGASTSPTSSPGCSTCATRRVLPRARPRPTPQAQRAAARRHGAARRADASRRSARPAARSRARCCARRSTRWTARAQADAPVHRHRAELHASRCVQPRGGNRHAVFFAHPREVDQLPLRAQSRPTRASRTRSRWRSTTSATSCSRPRSATAAASRIRRCLPQDQARQTQLLVTCTENAFTNADRSAPTRTARRCRARRRTLRADRARRCRTGSDALHASTRSLDAGDAAQRHRLRAAHARRLAAEAADRARAHAVPPRRPRCAGDRCLLPGQLESLALPGESYKLAFTPGLLAQVYRRPRRPTRCSPTRAATCTARATATGGCRRAAASSRRTPATRRRRSWPSRASTSSCRSACAIRSATSTDGRATTRYDLLPIATRATPLGNTRAASSTTTACCSRAWSPTRTATAREVAFDALGMVVGTAVMGKAGRRPRATRWTASQPISTTTTVAAHLADAARRSARASCRAPPRASSTTSSPTSAREPTRSRSRPWSTRWRARPTMPTSAPGEPTRVQHSFAYSDGFGREIQKKIQAEPGPLDAGGPAVDPALGRQRLDGLQQQGQAGPAVRAVLQRHAPLRVRPCSTASARSSSTTRSSASSPRCIPTTPGRRCVFDPWRQETWDVNDTVLIADPADDPDVGDFFRRLPDADYLPTWHAQRIDGALGPREQAAARQGRGPCGHADGRPPRRARPAVPDRRAQPVRAQRRDGGRTLSHPRRARHRRQPARGARRRSQPARVDRARPHRHALRLRHARQPRCTRPAWRPASAGC